MPANSWAYIDAWTQRVARLSRTSARMECVSRDSVLSRPQSMRTREIREWLCAANVADSESPYDPDDEMAPGYNERMEETKPMSWDDFVSRAAAVLRSPQTNRRHAFLRDIVPVLARDPETVSAERVELYQLLLQTHQCHPDRASRLALMDAAEVLLRADVRDTAAPFQSMLIDAASDMLRCEVLRLCGDGRVHGPRFAAASVHAWTSVLLSVVLEGSDEHLRSDPHFATLLDTYAVVHLALLATRQKPHDRLLNSSLHMAWRTIRRGYLHVPLMLDVALAMQGVAGLRSVVLQGLLLDVCLHLRVGRESAKGVEGGVGRTFAAAAKERVLQYYTTHVVSAKSAVPTCVLHGLDAYLRVDVTEADLDAHVFPTLNKMLLRSPDVALAAAAALCGAVQVGRGALLARLQQPLLASAVSTSAATRRGAQELARALLCDAPDAESLGAFTTAVCASLKAAETKGEEQRTALCAVVAAMPAAPAWSARVAEGLAGLIQKEAQPAALATVFAALWVHVAPLLREQVAVPAPTTKALLAKLTSPKAPVRAAAAASLADAQLPYETSAATLWFNQLRAALGACVKSAMTTALTSADAALEGCAAVLLLARVPGEATVPEASPASLLAAVPKPSFLVSDKVARRMREAGTLERHASALGAAVQQRGVAHLHEPALQSAVLALVLEYTHGAGAPLFALLEQIVAADRALAVRLVDHAVRAAASAEEPPPPSKLRRMLHIAVAPGAGDAAAVLPDLVVLSHVTQLHDTEHECFVHLCRLASAEPGALVRRERDAILRVIGAAQSDVALSGAADLALSTVAFVAPDVILPSVSGSVVRDLSVRNVAAFTAEDLAIYEAPADVPYVDVLAAKSTVSEARTGMDKWDAEVRASLAAKKQQAAPRKLSKQEQAAVDAQLAKEAEVRARVAAEVTRMSHALRRVRALVAARTTALDAYMHTLTHAVYTVLKHERVRRLGLVQEAVDALAALAAAVEERARGVARFVQQAMLRRVDDELASRDFLFEAAADVELRVLYQLRLMVDTPLERGTMGFFVPWLADVVRDAALTGDPEADDAVVERMQLVLDVLAAHAASGSDAAFPRAEVIDTLLSLVRGYSMLTHDGVAALRAYGEAMAREPRGEHALVVQLLHAALSDERRVRDGALQCLVPLDLTELEFSPTLWLALHDRDAEMVRIAERIWDENGLDVPPSYVGALVPLLEHGHAYVRAAAAEAIGTACAAHPDTFDELLDALQRLYESLYYSLEPEYDAYGMVIESTLHREDPWPARVAIAAALRAIAPCFTAAAVVPFFVFALRRGAVLSDRHERVRSAMLDAATAVVDAHGAEVLRELIAQLEMSLDADNDAVTEAAVVLLGRAARHLAPEDAHVRRVVDRLLDALRTPSELVQEAVAACLPPLVRTAAVHGDVPAIVDQLFAELLHGASYAARRGAAYGLAGVVAGCGVDSIRALRILPRLADAIDDTTTSAPRQGALMAYETLAGTLRVLFEPYVGAILKHLLVCFGDAHADVREATADTARVLMRCMSGQCLKLVLPSLLAGLDEKQWRTKKGAIELLGAMAYCAPRQLSAALPTVIPRLSDVLTDSHTQVRTAANRSLKQFGEVIHNPEVRALVPTLLKALVDPNAKTAAALKALLGTKFVHYIDGPSLALIAPILERGLKERAVSAQKQSAQIVGNFASLTDARDYVPYLARYTPLVREVLVSPVPDARGVAAKALGTLVERLGEVHFVDLVPSLLHVLQTDATGVDRHGAAQGLAEVLAGLGMERMERLLPTIIENTQAGASYVREGHLALLIYLPATFGSRFVPHLGRIVAPIVASISDDVESVRDASIRAGRMMIINYTPRAVELLLPQLESRLFDERGRVRLAALQLVSDLLFRLAGISGKAEVEDETDEAAAASSSVQKALISALGADRRARLLAAIYVLRQDPNLGVRQTAAHTWKALVHNTPRTARDVLPVMLDLLLGALAGAAEQREMAGRTLGELVRKLGEKILGETIPLLAERAAHAPAAETRAGVCRAVTDILANATKTQLESHEEALIAIVRGALADDAAEVRGAAARALDAMQTHLGGRAIDATVPTLLAGLRERDGRADTALAALREVVRTRADVVFPVVVPTLTADTCAAHMAALAAVVPVADVALAPLVSNVLGAVMQGLEAAGAADASAAAEAAPDAQKPAPDAPATRSQLQAAADAVFATATSIDALHQTLMLLLSWTSARTPERRALACDLFVRFCHTTSADWSDYTVDFVRRIVSLFADESATVLAPAWRALDACVQAVGKDAWGTIVVPLRRSLESTGTPLEPLAGLCQPRGAAPFVPVFLHGLMHGSAELREQGALGLADIVEKTTPEAAKPFITAMVGPLIRLCGDRHAPPVKAAILTSLDTMVHRVPQLVRPFYPQLQRSFQKALSDPASGSVRAKAAEALGWLMGLQMRVEGVVNELVQTVRAALDAPVEGADAAALALSYILRRVAQDKIGADARANLAACLDNAFHAAEEPRDPLKVALAELCAALLAFDAAAAAPVLDACVLTPEPVDVQLAAMCLRACVADAPVALYEHVRPPALVAQLVSAWTAEAPSVARPARETRDLLKKVAPWSDDDAIHAAL